VTGFLHEMKLMVGNTLIALAVGWLLSRPLFFFLELAHR
jgi:hypothetical protein